MLSDRERSVTGEKRPIHFREQERFVLCDLHFRRGIVETKSMFDRGYHVVRWLAAARAGSRAALRQTLPECKAL
jgi:hypothetical protein